MYKFIPLSWIVPSIVTVYLGSSVSALGQTAEVQWDPFVPIAEGWREVPSELINEPDEDDMNGPCSQCAIRTIKQTEDADSPPILEVYFDDDRSSFCGTLELEALLSDGTTELTLLEDVVLSAQEISAFTLEDMPWSWEKVTQIWVVPVSEC